MDVIAELKDECRILPLNTEPLFIKNPADPNQPTLVSCDGIFSTGRGRLSKNSSSKNLVKGIREIQSSLALVVPSSDSIIASLNRQAVQPAHRGRQIFLLGASNMEQLRRHILDLALPAGLRIVNLCEKGDFLHCFLEHPKILELLKAGTSNDTLFFNPWAIMSSYGTRKKIKTEHGI